jgi:hypothetical protein
LLPVKLTNTGRPAEDFATMGSLGAFPKYVILI